MFFRSFASHTAWARRSGYRDRTRTSSQLAWFSAGRPRFVSSRFVHLSDPGMTKPTEDLDLVGEPSQGGARSKPGVEDLTAADHLTSQFPYSYSAQRFRTFFFDVCNKDDGKSWSTPFVIDDPQLFVVNDSRIASVVNRKMQREAKRKAQQNVRQQAKPNAKVARKPKSKR